MFKRKQYNYCCDSSDSNDIENDNDNDNYNKKHKKIYTSKDNSGITNYHYPDKYEKSIFIAGKNEIHFNAQVDGDSITRIKKLISIIIDENKRKLVKFDADGKIPAERENDPKFVITYIVHSPGGSVHDVLDFVDYIALLKSTFANIRFTSIITGMVASAGTIMCVIADKKQMTRFAYAMIHELSTGLGRNNYTRLNTHAKFLSHLHDTLLTIYQESRNISINDKKEMKKLKKLLLKETYMTAEQYKKRKFIDEVICQRPIPKNNDDHSDNVDPS